MLSPIGPIPDFSPVLG
ncbi:MAG TPA: hypothetical protein VFS81_24445, partial [Candidatus Binatia bacterium]|nr:hypothetical protein [Candidatus Binatia bacterium]